MKGGDFVSYEEKDVIQKLKKIEAALQDHENGTSQLMQVIEELKNVVKDLDKDMAIQSEKQSHLFYRIEQLKKELEEFEQTGEKSDTRQRDLIEKALIAFLGGLITYIFSIANN